MESRLPAKFFAAVLRERFSQHEKQQSAQFHTFQFPVKGGGSFLKIETVLLSNGHGWRREVWMKKLNKANERGALWGFDYDENERRGMRVFHANESK